MKIWDPNECKKLYNTLPEYYGGGHPVTVFKINDYWLPERLDLLMYSYSHDIDYVNEAFTLTSWPDIDYILKPLMVYVLRDVSHDHFNGSAGVHRINGSLGESVIILFGRSTPIPRHMTHYVAIHELGHVIQETYCDEFNNKASFEEYKKLRGIEGKSSSMWTKDWKQLWAEDWRWLFGLTSAHQYTWSMDYPAPGDNIKQFMLNLIPKYHKARGDKY